MEHTHWRNPDTGLIETVDAQGNIVCVQQSFHLQFNPADTKGFVERTLDDGRVIFVEAGIDIPKISSWKYTPMLGGAIASEVAGGCALSTLSKKYEWCPPYSTIVRWMARIPEFKTMIDQAMKDRALVHLEEAKIVADSTYQNLKGTDDEVAAAKLKIDTTKFLVEKGDAEKYGNRKTAGGDGTVQIFIDTGIRRDDARDVTPALEKK